MLFSFCSVMKICFVLTIGIIIAFAAAGGAGFAQLRVVADPPNATIPPPNHPEVYFSFLHFHDKLTQSTTAKAAQQVSAKGKQDEKDRIEANIARMYNFSRPDLVKTTAIAQKFVADIQTLDGEIRTYRNKRSAMELPPLPSQMSDFENKRQKLIEDGVTSLKKTLSPAAWAALSGYVNGPYRQNIQMISAARH